MPIVYRFSETHIIADEKVTNACDMEWMPFVVMSSAHFYRYGDSGISFGRMQRDLDRIARLFCDTVTYPTAWDGAIDVHLYDNLTGTPSSPRHSTSTSAGMMAAWCGHRTRLRSPRAMLHDAPCWLREM